MATPSGGRPMAADFENGYAIAESDIVSDGSSEAREAPTFEFATEGPLFERKHDTPQLTPLNESPTNAGT